MLRDTNEGWSSPPPSSGQPGGPPRDYAPDDEPPYVRRHPIKMGIAGALIVLAALALSPLIIIATAAWLWSEAFKWATS